METSAVQSLKIAIVQATGLSKDALHIYVGLLVFLVASWLLRRRSTYVLPLTAVLAVATVGELIDMRDDLRSLGYWRWAASLHDVVNTVFWPALLAFLASRQLLPWQRNV